MPTTVEEATAAQGGPGKTAGRAAAVSFRGVSKRFGIVEANNGVSFDVVPGTVHAILGENGAGKTTLVSMLAGKFSPDSGQIHLDGKEVRFRSPLDARRLGIGMVQQHPPHLPSLSVAEYLFMEDPEAGWYLHRKSYEEALRVKIGHYGIVLDLDRKMGELSVGEAQWLEVFRLLHLGAAVLILDEPTAMLAPVQAEELLERVRAIADEGNTVLLVTHKLHEVQQYADFVTVLRQGEVAHDSPIADTSVEELADRMVGEGNIEAEKRRSAELPAGEALPPHLEVKKICVNSPRGSYLLEDVSFVLHRGEILGVAGISGNGQQELAEVVTGLRRPDSGSVSVVSGEGKEAGHHFDMIGYVPEDRIGLGAPGLLSVAENLVLRDLKRPPITKNIFIDQDAMMATADERAKRFNVKVADLDSPTAALSGGNIQRLVLARELRDEFELFVMHNPTAGLDIKGVRFVRNRLVEAVGDSGSVLLISNDLDEIFELADRILVLFTGKSMGVFRKGSVSRSFIGALMAGEEPEGAVKDGTPES